MVSPASANWFPDTQVSPLFTVPLSYGHFAVFGPLDAEVYFFLTTTSFLNARPLAGNPNRV